MSHDEGRCFWRMDDDERGRDEEEQGVEDGAGHDGQEDNLGHRKATAEFKSLLEPFLPLIFDFVLFRFYNVKL